VFAHPSPFAANGFRMGQIPVDAGREKMRALGVGD